MGEVKHENIRLQVKGTEVEKEACLKRANELNHGMLVELYNTLAGIKNKGSIYATL